MHINSCLKAPIRTMKHTKRLTLPLLFLLCFPFSATAEDMQLDLSLHNIGLDAGGSDDFKRGQALSLNYNYLLTSWLALDSGIFISNKVQDEKKADLAGTLRASLATRSLSLGLKPQYRFSSPFQLYAKLGLLYWQTEVEVEEYFNEEIPPGTDSADDDGWGYYAGIGAGYFITETITLQLEFNRQFQPDIFKGKSDFPFDLEISTFALGAGFRF